MQASLTQTDRRTGATWVAATGAFLLVAAAAVFVAVRWDDLPDALKLAVLGALTGTCMLAGRALRRTLPATGDVLFHLGAFLLLVDLAGANLRTGYGWRPFLLTEGLLGVIALGGLGVLTESVVLRWAGTASMLAVAAGIAAVTPLPAPLVLAAVAATALVVKPVHRQMVTFWSASAGLAPLVAALTTWMMRTTARPGLGVWHDLGLDGSAPWSLVVVAAIVSTAVLARQARRRDSTIDAVLALVSATIGAAAAWADSGIVAKAVWIGPAAAFLLVELVALSTARDAFWRRHTAFLASIVEWLATPSVVLSGVVLTLAPLLFHDGFFGLHWAPNPVAGLAWAVVALAWFTADLRRSASFTGPAAFSLLLGSGTSFTTLPLAAAAVAAIAIGSTSALWTAVALVGVAALLVASGRPFAGAVSALFCLWAPIMAGAHVVGSPAVAAAGALTLAAAAALRLRLPSVDSRTSGYFLTVAAAFAVLEGFGHRAWRWDLPVAVLVLWLVAAWVDRAAVPAGHIARGTIVFLVAINAPFGPPALVGVTAALATMILIIDAVRLERVELGYAAAGTVQVAVAAGAVAAGYSLAPTGLALCLSAVVWAGLAAVVEGSWQRPLLAAAGAASVAGLALATGNAVVMSEAVMVTGALVLAAGVALRSAPAGYAGGILITAGMVGRVALIGVPASEAYVAPVALYLVIVGWQLRRTQRLSSWVAYGPGIALLGGGALAERMAGGPGWHAIVAGAVGVAAVVIGGGLRLAGPLFIGTGLLIATTAHESLAQLAGVPTWGWLGLGGTVMLLAAMGMERTDASPVETGRRLVDSISERFD